MVGVSVGTSVAVSVGVAVGSSVLVGVSVGTSVAVSVGVSVGTRVWVSVGVGVATPGQSAGRQMIPRPVVRPSKLVSLNEVSLPEIPSLLRLRQDQSACPLWQPLASSVHTA